SMSLKQRKFEAAKSEILSAAAKMFFEKGFKDVTVEDIAKEVGLSPGALYYYFKGKEDIFLCLDNEATDRFMEVINSFGGVGRDKNAEETIVELVEKLCAFAGEHRDYFLFLFKMATSVNRELFDELTKKRLRLYLKLRRKLAEIIKTAVERGEIRDINAEDMSLFLIGVVHGLFFNWFIKRIDDAELPGKIRMAVGIFFDGVRKKEER
ncbi:MAG: TetR/AcrR family transcriptional regulator, partial [Deltaproteobacteria bacterium]|nr:TetR/AcrR family transcriptional regulator [Deltaproteobacteria bacterium]